jgi:hypothetical protein
VPPIPQVVAKWKQTLYVLEGSQGQNEPSLVKAPM